MALLPTAILVARLVAPCLGDFIPGQRLQMQTSALVSTAPFNRQSFGVSNSKRRPLVTPLFSAKSVHRREERKLEEAANKKEQEKLAAQKRMEEMSNMWKQPEPEIRPCPGASGTCDYDDNHRVCAQVLDDSGKPLAWGDKSFWDHTDLKNNAGTLSDVIRKNGGDSWCVDMWQAAGIIEKVGCENVHVRCDATDYKYVMDRYWEGELSESALEAAEYCFEKECVVSWADLATSANDVGDRSGRYTIPFLGFVSAGSILGAVVAFTTTSHRHKHLVPDEPLLG